MKKLTAEQEELVNELEGLLNRIEASNIAIVLDRADSSLTAFNEDGITFDSDDRLIDGMKEVNFSRGRLIDHNFYIINSEFEYLCYEEED